MPEEEPTADLELYREPDPEEIEIEVPLDGDESDAPSRARERRIVAVSGAKGGVGKTIFATNLAVYLATIGRKVVVVDAEPEGANAHTCLGVEPPARTPGATAEKAREDLASRLVETPVPGLSLLHAGVDEPREGRSRRTSRRSLARLVNRLDADYVVVDLGAGTDRTLVDFWLAADLSLFVTAPEPTAIEGTYRFIRAAFARRLRAAAQDRATRARVVERLRAMGNTPAPLDLARRLEAAGDPLSEVVRETIDAFRFQIVLNQTRLRADLELGDAMRSAVRRRLGLFLEYLGYVDYDDTVWTCVRMRRPLLVESPGTKASKNIEKIARRLVGLEAGKRRARPVRTVPAESHHDILEVERGATDEEIRRAFKRVKDIYALDALCCYGLFDQQALDSLRARLEEAYDVLLDPARRRPYELSVFPAEPAPRSAPSDQTSEAERPPPPVITPDTEYTGALLRAVRESQGVDLLDISQRTKIGASYVEAIESDDFPSLPAPVYVRGFVTEVAKYLRLDAAQVSRTYVRRYQRWIDEREKTP